MSWDVLIRLTEGEHAEFWSAEVGANGYTGLVNYGKLGGTARSHNYHSDMAIRDKIRAKLNEGYHKVNGVQTGPSPSYLTVMGTLRRAGWTRANVNETLLERRVFVLDVRRDINGANRDVDEQAEAYNENNQPEPEPEPEPAPSPVQRARERVAQARPKPIIPGEFKTNTQGFLSKYRTGYQRVVFSTYLKKLEPVSISTLVDRQSNTTDYNLAEDYFIRIPADTVYNKPAHFRDLRDPHKPTFTAIYDRSKTPNTCIAIYNINRSTGVSDFFSIKTTAQHRNALVGFIMGRLANVNPREGVIVDIIQFKLKSQAMIKTMKQVAPFYQSVTINSIKFKRSDLKTSIELPQVKPARWFE